MTLRPASLFPHANTLILICVFTCTSFLFCCKESRPKQEIKMEETGPDQSDLYFFEMRKDPALGYIPRDRFFYALDYTNNLRKTAASRSESLPWIERGPSYDLTSGGSIPTNLTHNSGRVRGILMDTLNDPTGNTVFCGGVSGGLWRCTNFLDDVPVWQPIDDYLDAMSISYICQDPTQPNIMYFSTGEPTATSSRFGKGVWKSVDAGLTWAMLPATGGFYMSFRILCDKDGNVYLAGTNANSSGLYRSKDQGATWDNITPATFVNGMTPSDVEISSTGRLHVSFGYRNIRVYHYYTSDPANVTATDGWQRGAGIHQGADDGVPFKQRMELACLQDTLYAVITNNPGAVSEVYKSIDGGANWTQLPTPTQAITGDQGWHDLSVGINPDSSNHVVIGGIQAWISKNSGQTYSGFASGVHVDHHFIQWFRKGSESWVIMGTDGGVFFSRNGGSLFKGKNRNLRLRQFYACSIHPAAGSNHILAGSQDNGTDRFVNPGLSFAYSETGGDGGYSHINQLNPQIQFAALQNSYMCRSTNGGMSFTVLTLAFSGIFISPFTYDDSQNILYASDQGNSMRRWINAHNTATSTSTQIVFNPLPGGAVRALTMSPFTANRLFIGSGNRLYRLDNANTVTTSNVATSMTSIGDPAFNGYFRCINFGTTENHIVAVFSSNGVNNVWYTDNGGASWSAVDGNLPDLNVFSAVFVPGSDSKLIIGTEMGVFSTDAVNSSSTVWMPHVGVPLIRVTMLKVRPSDNTIIASTYGRGLFSAIIPNTVVPVELVDFNGKLEGDNIFLNWQTASEQGNKGFEIERSNDGVNFRKIGFVAGAGNSNVLRPYSFIDRTVDQPLNYYRLRQVNNDNTAKYSAVILVKYPFAGRNFITSLNLSRSNSLDIKFGNIEKGNGEIRLSDLSGRTLLRWNGMLDNGSTLRLQVPNYIPVGLYVVQVIQKNKKYSAMVEK